jgi:type II secretory pathway component PulJ
MTRSGTYRSRSGVGMIELLMALAIGGLVLGLAAAFFGLQTRVSRDTQARNELNVRARAVGEAIVQDVRMAGARAVVDSEGRVVFRSALPCDPDPVAGTQNECVTVRLTGVEDHVDRVEVYYVSSLFLEAGTGVGQVCRRVTYELVVGTLYRSDVECASAPAARNFATEFAADIRSLAVRFMCNDATLATPDPQACYTADDGFVREGQVTVDLASPRDPRLSIEFELATAMLNMRAPDRFAEAP